MIFQPPEGYLSPLSHEAIRFYKIKNKGSASCTKHNDFMTIANTYVMLYPCPIYEDANPESFFLGSLFKGVSKACFIYNALCPLNITVIDLPQRITI